MQFQSQLVIYHGSSKSKRKIGIYMKIIGILQGYEIVAGLFEICKNTENRLGLDYVNISLYMQITVKTNKRNLSVFMPKKQGNCRITRLVI